MESIECRPAGFFTNNYHLESVSNSGFVEFNWFTEQGQMTLNETNYEVEKQGPLSGQWILKNPIGDQEIIRAEKPNPITRTFELQTVKDGNNYQLKAETALGRTMLLTGPDHDCCFRPAHPFTRRATISGRWNHFELVAFSFWLVGLVWRRARNNNHGAAGS